MSAKVFQITGVSIACSKICWGADQIKHQSSASLTFVKGIHRWPHGIPWHCGSAVVEKLYVRAICVWHWKCLHVDEILITGGTGTFQNEKFQCSQWWKFCQKLARIDYYRQQIFWRQFQIFALDENFRMWWKYQWSLTLLVQITISQYWSR